MSALVSLLFPAPALRRQPLEVVRWWEARRGTYNLVVGGAGLVTLAAFELLVRIPLRLGEPFPWPAVIAYGILANLCYAVGPLAEVALERWVGRETYGLGPALWRHGLVFSVGLTLVPIGAMVAMWGIRLLSMVGG